MQKAQVHLTHKYCVYALAYPNDNIFYVGKGNATRLSGHFSEARNNMCRCKKCQIIQSIWRQQHEVRFIVLFETDSNEEALGRERAEIDRLRKLYPLCNWQGAYGRKPIPATQAMGMTLTEYREHLGHYPLTKREHRTFMLQFGIEKIHMLEKAWQAARRKHNDERADQLADEIEAMAAAVGRVWQHEMTLEPPRTRKR